VVPTSQGRRQRPGSDDDPVDLYHAGEHSGRVDYPTPPRFITWPHKILEFRPL
jgi:hypothetical protein